MAAGNDNVGAGFGQAAGHRLAETFTAARYQGRFAGQVEQVAGHVQFLSESATRNSIGKTSNTGIGAMRPSHPGLVSTLRPGLYLDRPPDSGPGRFSCLEAPSGDCNKAPDEGTPESGVRGRYVSRGRSATAPSLSNKIRSANALASAKLCVTCKAVTPVSR